MSLASLGHLIANFNYILYTKKKLENNINKNRKKIINFNLFHHELYMFIKLFNFFYITTYGNRLVQK